MGGGDNQRAGDINIYAVESISLGSSRLETVTEGVGRAGNVLIETFGSAGSVTFDNNSRVDTDVLPEAEGAGGNITINTHTLGMNGSSALRARTGGEGDAGDVIINALGSVGNPRAL